MVGGFFFDLVAGVLTTNTTLTTDSQGKSGKSLKVPYHSYHITTYYIISL